MYPPEPPKHVASLVPSAEDATLVQCLAPAEVLCTHVTPESVEVQIYPKKAAATSLVPSAEDTTERQSEAPAEVLCTHVTPESVEV